MKVYNYIILFTGLLLLFEMGGIPTGASGLLNVIGIGTSSASVSVSDFYLAIFGASGILIGLALGISIGVLTRSNPENFIILPLITGILTVFVGASISIMNYSFANHPTYISSIILLILGALTLGYIFSLVEFFRGTD